ncbi:TIGR03915 family putative DNA repair protein [Lachnotalea glycerini]|nr:TIGR03915 family putative DNA repair protein [Lachnotalea glycerini]
MNKRIYLCEDSVESIFTGVYNAWEDRYPKEFVELSVNSYESNYELFSEYINVVTDFDKANRVAKTLELKFGNEVYTSIYQAALSNAKDKAQAVFKTINIGLKSKRPRQLMENLQDKHICRVFELSRAVFNERSHLLGFVRFKELNSQVLCSVIEPKNNVVMLIAPHFADRLPGEKWMIYDKGRNIAVIHEKGEQWGVIKSEKLNFEMLKQMSDSEKLFEAWWKGFCESISIKERKNIKLQKQNLPLRFQENMVEFH